MGTINVFNVKDYGATGNGSTPDTTAIQAAIDAQAAAGRGIVFFPEGIYKYTTLKYKNGTHLQGTPYGGQFGAAGSVLSQIVTTADVLLKNDNTAITVHNLTLVDLLFTAYDNQATNTGGVLIERVLSGHYERVQVAYSNNYGFHVKSVAGDNGGTMNNSLLKCAVQNTPAGASCYLLTSAGATDHPDGTTLLDCLANADSTWIKVVGDLTPQPEDEFPGADGLAVVGCRFIGTASLTAIDHQGYAARFIGNRFEITQGALTVTLAPSGGITVAAAAFVGNQWAAPGGLTWNDTGVMRSPRQDFLPISSQFVTLAPHYETPVDIQSFAPTVNQVLTPDLNKGEKKAWTITNTNAFKIGVPFARQTGVRLVLDVKNGSGGTLGITLDTVYRTAGTFVKPANGKRRVYEFYDDGTNLVEICRSSADI